MALRACVDVCSKGQGLCCLKEDNVQISMTDVLVIRDFVGCSANQMESMKRILKPCLDLYENISDMLACSIDGRGNGEFCSCEDSESEAQD